VAALEAALGVQLPDRALALASLTHKTYVNEHPLDAPSDNERLEFLGDAVVDLAVSHRLMERHPTASEGELTRMRALIVNEEGLARVARTAGLGELLLLGRGEALSGGRQKSSVLADGLEAVIAAVYLSGGLPAALALVDRLFADVIAGVAEGKSGEDYKTGLQKEVQPRLGQPPRYRVVAESGPDHAKTFEVEVVLGETTFARGGGRSKKEAEQAAAREALRLLGAPPEGG
jgi:ribonuclease-3